MILKILLENLDFSIEKIDFSIEKIKNFNFFWISKFSKSFFSKKKQTFFDEFFFLPQVMWGLQGFMLRVVWESICTAAPKDL